MPRRRALQPAEVAIRDDLFAVIERLLHPQVYFVQEGDGGPIKIGFAQNVLVRLAQLQTGNPKPLMVLATTPGGQSRERTLHKLFERHLIRGEWFSPADPVTNFIKAHGQAWAAKDQRYSVAAASLVRSIRKRAKREGEDLEAAAKATVHALSGRELWKCHDTSGPWDVADMSS